MALTAKSRAQVALNATTTLEPTAVLAVVKQATGSVKGGTYGHYFRPAIAALALAAVVSIAGCGATTTTPTSTPASTKPQAPTTTTPRSTPPSTKPQAPTTTPTSTPPTSLAGTITMTGSGTTVVETVSLSKIGYGQSAAPAEEVLSSGLDQNLANPTVVATSAFVYGVLTFKYVGGRVPIDLSFDTPGVAGAFVDVSGCDFGSNGGVCDDPTGADGPPASASGAPPLLQIGGQWTAGGSGTDPVGFSMQPNETVDVPMWIQFPGAVSNTQATIPQAQLNVMSWYLTPYVGEIGTNLSVTYSGPQVAKCADGTQALLPFAKHPSCG
jgi:hypothetical protein